MALDLFSQFATDENLENNGAWHDIGGDAKLLVARGGNRKYVKLLTKLVEQNKRILDGGGEAADAKSDEIMTTVIADTLLLGWEGVIYKGKELTYSGDNVKLVLGMKEFRKLVAKLADDQEAYRVREEAEQGKA